MKWVKVYHTVSKRKCERSLQNLTIVKITEVFVFKNLKIITKYKTSNTFQKLPCVQGNGVV